MHGHQNLEENTQAWLILSQFVAALPLISLWMYATRNLIRKFLWDPWFVVVLNCVNKSDIIQHHEHEIKLVGGTVSDCSRIMMLGMV